VDTACRPAGIRSERATRSEIESSHQLFRVPPMSKPKNASPQLHGKEYWRSLDDLENSPEYQKLIEQEFPGLDEAASSGINRRKFLTIMGASLSLAGLSSCRRPVEKIVPYVSKPEDIILGNPQHYATSMAQGNDVYNLLVEAHEGRPTKIAGNKLNPFSGTSTNVWANASVLGLYDPDRSRSFRNGKTDSTLNAFLTAWQAIHTGLAAKEGEGFAVLSESYSSPTTERLFAEFRKTFPKADVVIWDPINDENIRNGMQLAASRESMPVYDFEKADVVLALDSDFLGSEFHQYHNALGFAKRRRVQDTGNTMNRLYVVENSLTQTSVMADHRLRLQSGRIGGFLAALIFELRGLGVSFPSSEWIDKHKDDTVKRHWVKAVAKDLLRAKGASVILAGRRQPAVVHALIYTINEALGNNGRTITYKAQPFSGFASTKGLVDLIQKIKDKKVNTLVILGGNPSYNAPADLDFKNQLGSVDHVIHLSAYVDETSAIAKWHVPQLHYLEAWGDTASIDGYLGVVQPLIAPLYAGKSTIEMLAILATGKDAKGYDLVQQTWKAFLSGVFEPSWRKVLHDGVYAHAIPEVPPVAPRMNDIEAEAVRQPFQVPRGGGKVQEIVFQTSYALYDGRYSNNGWLQELPDPVTKIMWDNCAVVSTRTAAELGIKNHQLIRISSKGNELVLPAWIMPGQADGSITIALGYGRTAEGRIHKGVGFNAYKLRRSDALHILEGADVALARGDYKLACVQDHHGLDTEKLAAKGIQERLPRIVHEADLEDYKKNPRFEEKGEEKPVLQSLWDEHKYDHGNQWGLSIDLNSCIGCASCTIACQSENNIPIVGKEQVLNGREMHWIRIDRYFKGTVEDPEVLTQPLACVQCEMAPCEQVCPVAATTHDAEGLNVMTYNRCIGTRYCSNNCPYKARRFNFFNYTKDYPETIKMAQNPDVTVRFRGVMEKCTYCVQRINQGKITAKRENRDLRDGDIATACQEACPTGAIAFGNILDPKSAVSKAKALDRDYAVLEELNIRPRTTYLAKLRNPNPDLLHEA
jgi:MoCo/4Fe-4S cofactor protein with predicted Tat translocation signal